MTRPLLRSLTATALSVALTATPALAKPCAGLTKKTDQTWMQYAGAQANSANDLERKGLDGDALKARERAMLGLTCAWRRDEDPAALEPLLIQLHRRLKKSTTAVEAALRLIYELYESPKLTAAQKARLDQLNTQLNLALLRLRRDAKPGDTSACDGPVGRRPGELAIQGLLPDEPVLVLRDVPGGEVEVVECPLAAGTTPLPTPKCSDCPPPTLYERDPDHWWFTGPGIALFLAGGALLGLGADAYLTVEERRDQTVQDTGEGGLGTEERRAEGRMQGYFIGGGTLALFGIAALATGIVIATTEDETGAASAMQLHVGPGNAALSLSF